MKKLLVVMLLSCVGSLSLQVSAAGGHNHGDAHKHALDAHAHGVANMVIAIDKNEVQIILISPSANIVGFEHKATSKKHVDAVNKGKSSLQLAKNLITFEDKKASKCQPSQVDVDVSALKSDSGHKHSHKHEEHADESHSDIVATYTFVCKSTDKLTSIKANLFGQFPSIETINVQWLSELSQGAAKLTARSNVIQLK